MKTDELIAHLSADLEPAPAYYVGRMLTLGAALGILLSGLAMLIAMGPRPDLAVAVEGPAFWMKLAYTLSLTGLGLWLVDRLGRADASARGPAVMLAVPVILLLVVAIVQFFQPGVDRHHLVLGEIPWRFVRHRHSYFVGADLHHGVLGDAKIGAHTARPGRRGRGPVAAKRPPGPASMPSTAWNIPRPSFSSGTPPASPPPLSSVP